MRSNPKALATVLTGQKRLEIGSRCTVSESKNDHDSEYFINAPDNFYRLQFEGSTVGYLRYRKQTIDGISYVDWHYFLHAESEVGIEDDFWGLLDEDESRNLANGVWIIDGPNDESLVLTVVQILESELPHSRINGDPWPVMFDWPTVPLRLPKVL